MTTEFKFDCVFCKEGFEDKEALLVHFRKHGDPNFNTKNKTRQQNEIINNEKSGEETELVGCDVCEEVFPTISKAITHKHKAHPDHDAKYFCPFCGKLFTMKHLYNKHLQSNHKSSEVSDNNDFHCDCCDATFYVASAMLYHNKFFHRQDTELPAFGQSKKVRTYNQVLLQIYYCAFCGEEYNNKVNLHKHMKDDHGDENQFPIEILRCPLCEAIFYHLDAYELHLTFHSTDDLYSEKNEMKEKITEFSLETVAPIIEKVEEELDEDDKINKEGIGSFLQLVMGDSTDNNPDKMKSKKHKKHKKSKKAAITLDEFLNMNKDVFGHGLNVQGIEEVPTQVVLKKVKNRKILNKPEPVKANLAKLKKHGIVVKTKPGSNPHLTNLNKDNVNVIKPKVISTPNEILSKLMNQGTSQIKIVKKSTSQNPIGENTGQITSDTLMTKSTDKPTNDSLNKEVDRDTSEHENEESIDPLSKELSIIKNDAIVNNDKLDSLQEDWRFSDLPKSDPQLPRETDGKIFENEANDGVCDYDKNTSSDSKRLCIADTKKSTATTTNETVSNSNLPHLDDLPSDSSIIAKETSSMSNNDDNGKKQLESNITNSTLNALKHLSHLITVKPLNHSKTINVSSKVNELPHNENNTLENKTYKESDLTTDLSIEKVSRTPLRKALGEHITVNRTKQLPSSSSNFNSDAESENREIDDIANTDCIKVNEPSISNTNVVEIRKLKVKNLPITQVKALLKNDDHTDDEIDNDEELKNEHCPKKSNLNILKRLTNVTAKPIGGPSVNQVVNIKQIKNNVCTTNEEVEIFNIDDSDSEGNENDTVNKITEKNTSSVTLNPLRNLGKNIVVKSNQQNVFPGELKEKGIETKNARSDTSNENKKSNKSLNIQRSINLQNQLKNLGGNVIVKSSNSSPNMFNKELYKSFEDYDDDNEGNDSDSGSIGKVKITEMQENDDSGNECNDSQASATIQSPRESNSENEDNDSMDNNISDFENQIKTNTLKINNSVTNAKNNKCLENFKNLNKELTIKSINKKYNTGDDVNLHQTEDVPEANEQIVRKPTRINISQNEESNNKSSQQASVCMDQAAISKKVSTSSNQVNTVKTVKRFQSETVIEEITTTVTKKIRRVNQSTNEVVQNICNLKPLIRPQSIINKQPGREIQGTKIRGVSPSIGTKVRTTANVIRHPNPTTVRPCHQIVPVRAASNLPRSACPSTSSVRKVTPLKRIPQKPVIGKLKISPHALNQTTKRPNETIEHFSCFKKPKESLVDPAVLADCEDDSAMQFSSATQSRSDFSGVSKTVKGKSSITATQTRSEISSSSQQHLSRLSNVSGLKIVKTNSKQATQEKYEGGAANRNTLEALEKLQKQGLSIKKPRIEGCNERQNSFSESDDEEFGWSNILKNVFGENL